MHITPFLQFVTGLSLIALMDISISIVQTIMKAVKKKIISSAMKVKPAYQMVTILLTFILIELLENFSILDKTCDGIFHCLYGEDEHFELCKDTFPNEATIECVENRLPGTIDITIMAIPCNGILECRDGRDENCEEDKMILVIAVAILFLTTICIYLYLVFVRLPFWKHSVLQDFIDVGIDFKTQSPDWSELKGNTLAKLKV